MTKKYGTCKSCGKYGRIGTRTEKCIACLEKEKIILEKLKQELTE